MEKTLFHDLLKKAGLSKKEFAAMVGTSAGAVSNWGTAGRDIPYWVEPFLNLYIENKECRNLKQILKEALKDQ
ncbi:hypothetical protein MNB_SV-4-1295 [hydrothermal vent metagenome]|uniref:HTH cro/C1-type domain-containing protein n=1 Tax=hydrothermal vent metagenome TaxID=652676 RepID=A0A1W1E8E8_9ZZZZ